MVMGIVSTTASCRRACNGNQGIKCQPKVQMLPLSADHLVRRRKLFRAKKAETIEKNMTERGRPLVRICGDPSLVCANRITAFTNLRWAC